MLVYPVQKGDTLWKIAQRFTIGLDALIAANPQISDPNYIVIGQQINIPELWQPPEPPITPMPAEPVQPGATEYPLCESEPEKRPCIYTARQGDTLEGIGIVFQIPLSRLLYYNLRYARNEPLAEGTRIVIPETEILPLTPPQMRRYRR